MTFKKTSGRLLLFILLVAIMGSCKKDSKTSNNTDNKSFYIKFKLKGAQKRYTYNATSLLAKPSVYACSLSAWGSATNTASVTIGLTDGSAFVTGKTYTEQVITVNGITTIQGSFTYKDDDGSTYFASGTTANTTLSLKFTEMADDHFKGTFTATLLQVGKSPLTYVPVTEGEFYVSRSL
ncbi:MAG TPA: hypothetical protein VK668_21705 [Mucilaginibacter sp.]|nr:hypothetical protein [Mucilaginibacter sp.]